MKIYAKQVPPEYQESPLFSCDMWPENVAVFGNRQYIKHTFSAFTAVQIAIYDGELLAAWEAIQEGRGYYDSWADALADMVPPLLRDPYTRDERKNAWPDLITRFWYAESCEYNAIYCEALELMTGRPWDCYTLRGCCQGDWQYMIYPADDWSKEALERFETEYFNTGTEWIIDPDGDCVSVYVTAWDDDGTRQELADAYGCSPDEIILQKFTGWSRTAQYMEVLPC
jgi:hypothetical protein